MSAAEDDLWDVIVIGTGMGGATAGWALAAAGRRVLFLDRGGSRMSWWPEPISQTLDGRTTELAHPLGLGAGGSSAAFAMVMERFRPADFDPRRFHSQPAEANLPERWPVSYDDLAPYYAKAEELFRVRGTTDPLFNHPWVALAPPPISAKEAAYLEDLARCELHPYRFHYACECLPGCGGCRLSVCPRECRNDAARICLRPAVEKHGAVVATECEAVKFETEGSNVLAVACRRQGADCRYRAKIFILAANALVSPLLLLRSASRAHPNGLANSSGQVGRNLMFHASDHLLLRSRRGRMPGALMNHGIALNDYYVADGEKLGNIHAHAFRVTKAAALAALQRRWPGRWRQPLLPPLAGLAVKSGMFSGGLQFTTIVEDLPYAANRILPTGPGERMRYEYTVAPELRHRCGQLLDLFCRRVAPRFKTDRLSDPATLNLAHPAGTCRFGDDPRTSVADRDNRAHDVDNLYIADSSFFPSSGGLNPSLTIAANALRVAERIGRRF